jgi:hypothetical protein
MPFELCELLDTVNLRIVTNIEVMDMEVDFTIL